MAEPRRRTTTSTLLFTDIEGSTRRWEESPTMFDLVEQHFDLLRRAVEDGSGTVFATLGDGIAAAFSSADAAVRTAIAAQRSLQVLGLDVRMGLHTGEVEHAGEDLRGRAVNRAARVMAMGHGGQILLSDVTAVLVRTGPNTVDLVDLGQHRLRDLAEPEHIWQVGHPDLVRAFPTLRGIDAFANNLPRQRSTLVGRDVDVRRVAAIVRAHRVVTLTGVGGVGKTRLAVHAAAELVGEVANVWFVPLADVADPRDVASALAAAIGATGTSEPFTAAQMLLGSRPTLLVVDNVEHVVDDTAALVDALTAACPELRVLATGREPLAIPGERVVPVLPLDESTSAVELFNDRAAAAGADLSGVPRATIERLCARLDGLPLAIELAAARTPRLGVDGVFSALEGGPALEHGSRRGLDDRHGTLRATIEWSFRLLEADEQRLFEWLSCFANGFELDAVDHLATGMGLTSPVARDHLESLVQRSMVVADPTGTGVRYRLLETMRTFATERLHVRGERLSARTAIADWVATLCGMPADEPCTPEVERRSVRLEREAENWREAAGLAAQQQSRALAARLCGPPAAWFLLGRNDLADAVHPLLDLCDTPEHRRAVLSAMLVSASGSTDGSVLGQWAAEVQAIDEGAPTGLGGLMQWVALAWQGDFVRSVEVCLSASADGRLSQDVRDLFLGIAVLDHYSLTGATTDDQGLVERALGVAARTDVALTRVLCRLGVAWALAGAEPGRSIELAHLALEDVSATPALTRVALPGSAARLLSGMDPSVAAAALLGQIDGAPRRGSFVDLVPLFYGAALLARVGDPGDIPSFEPVGARPLASPLSMMDVVDQARRAATSGDAGSMVAFESRVRAGLAEIVAGAAEPTVSRTDPAA